MVVGLVVQPLPDVSGVELMVHDPTRDVTQSLGQRTEFQDLLGVIYAPVVGNRHAELHGALLITEMGRGSGTNYAVLAASMSRAVSMATSAVLAPMSLTLPPARSRACSLFSVVNTPKIAGTPVSSATELMPLAA